MRLDIAVLPGDGIGPEVMTEGIRVLESTAKLFGHEVKLHYGEVGGMAID
ncbi:MAG: isocitrate/isopropylmalate family dehydrogenase, partial [Chloroflexota bacterium]